jgi:hypothetical protein
VGKAQLSLLVKKLKGMISQGCRTPNCLLDALVVDQTAG